MNAHQTTVIDALPRLMSDAISRMNGAYRANDEEAGAAHFERFNKLWDQAIERSKATSTTEWKRA